MFKRIVRIGASTLLTLALTATSAFAFTPPTLKLGSQGDDVALVQRLLTQAGQPVAITSLIGPTTQQLIQSFQRSRGLTADGVVGPNTWAALSPTLRRGSRGTAVVALQVALSRKIGYPLTADGIFGPGTESAVRQFQAHLGLTADGVVGPATWSALEWHFEQMPASGTGFYLYSHDGEWGTANTIALVKEVARQWAAAGNSDRLGIGDISHEDGGYFYPHVSHQFGVDVDIRVVRRDGREYPANYYDSAYDLYRTQKLIDLFQATGQVELILSADTRLKGTWFDASHIDHIHVRFKR